jgi:phospho-N-acetylmuramoyl-pentapeptide-transferase
MGLQLMTVEIIRLLVLVTGSFILAWALSPLLSYFLYRFHFYKNIRDSQKAPIMAALHAKKAGTPVGGGILIWFILLLVTFGLELCRWWWQDSWLAKLAFLSRPETFLPLGALFASAAVGLVDDWMNVRGRGPNGGGLSVSHRLVLYLFIAVVGAWWFFGKLSWDVLHVPFAGNYALGWWYVIIFAFVIVATSFSVNETDGLDGLAGGTLLIAFASYVVIAMVQGKFNLAAMIAVILGGLLAFLWYNIGPAKYFMGDTGVMALGTTLGIVAALTNTIFLLPFFAFICLIESLSVILQVGSKKLFRKKIFLSAPIHHHFEAIGWPEAKIVMRFWMVAGVAAALGLAIFLLDRAL